MSDNDDTGKRYWYVRRRGRISGPYSSGLIQRQVLLGRIGNDDELSHDQQGWKRLTQLSELVPSVLNADPDDPVAMQRLHAARRWADDREYGHHSVLIAAEENERRTAESGDLPHHPDHGNLIAEKLNKKKRERWNNNFFALLMVLIMATVVGYYFSSTQPVSDVPIDCFAPAERGVNWSNCFMQGASLAGADLEGAYMMNANFIGANFSHANMSKADLSYASMLMVNAESARLVSAKLVGANFKGANLSQADLSDTDMSYANLLSANISGAIISGAKLDNARWIDGRICAAGSVSNCE